MLGFISVKLFVCLFKSNRLGVWLFMSEMPYGTLSSNMLWRLFFVMHCAESEHLEKLCPTLQPADCKQRLKGRISTLGTNSNWSSYCCISYGFSSSHAALLNTPSAPWLVQRPYKCLGRFMVFQYLFDRTLILTGIVRSTVLLVFFPIVTATGCFRELQERHAVGTSCVSSYQVPSWSSIVFRK